MVPAFHWPLGFRRAKGGRRTEAGRKNVVLSPVRRPFPRPLPYPIPREDGERSSSHSAAGRGGACETTWIRTLGFAVDFGGSSGLVPRTAVLAPAHEVRKLPSLRMNQGTNSPNGS